MIKKTGKNLKYLRKNNMKEVVKFLTIHQTASRVQLAKQLGLSKMTITNIITELMSSGYVIECGSAFSKQTAGPKPILLTLKQNHILSIGIYVSRQRILGSLTDIVSGEVTVEEKKIGRFMSSEELIENIAIVIKKILLYDKELNKKIIGIGVAIVGLVDEEQGIYVRGTEFIRETNIEIKKKLEERFPYSVFLRNEIQATALAEQIYGLGKNCSHFLYIGVTHGIGTAVISDGQVLTGSRGFAVEAGHMSVDYNGKQCDCGNKGCLELYVSIPILLKKTQCTDVEHMMNKYKNRNAETVKVIRNFIQIMSTALINLSNIFDTEIIIIGHEGALFQDEILRSIECCVNEGCIWKKEKQVKVLSSCFKSLGPLRGAASIVFQRLFDGQIELDGVSYIQKKGYDD